MELHHAWWGFFIIILMLTKNTVTHINLLSQKKYRERFNEFIAEGAKLVSELLKSDYQVKVIYLLPDMRDRIFNTTRIPDCEIVEVTVKEMQRITQQKTPSDVLAIVKIPEANLLSGGSPAWNILLKKELALLLDNIQDPGNLGTIIRTADWFGIKNIICSGDTVDVYNPKVVQATMGSITRVSVHYQDIIQVLESAGPDHIPVYGTFLSGENIYQHQLGKNGLIVLGNEGKGISAQVSGYVTTRLFIPSFRSSGAIAESLNVSVATAIVCSEFRRRNLS